MNLIDTAFDKAVEVLRRNVTDRGFSAAPHASEEPPSDYEDIWARDSAVTTLWSLPLHDRELTDCARRSLETIFHAQLADGHLPNLVHSDTGSPNFSGTGNIAAIDGAMWVVSALWGYVALTGDTDFGKRYYNRARRAVKWLRSHDSNNCGLIEIPESSDWTDLFPRSYNVLYDEVLWYRCNQDFTELCRLVGRPVRQFEKRSYLIKKLINARFWPSRESLSETMDLGGNMHFTLGRSRYLLAQVTPFGFSWRCDIFANLLTYLDGVIDDDRAEYIWRYLRQIHADKPYPVKVLYPSINPGDADWRDYFLVNLLNLPDHYHNGGIWPFVGGLWVRYMLRLGKMKNAEEALERLARLNQLGVYNEWEFNEWAHGKTGEVMGKPFQAWSAASYVAAYLAFQGDETVATMDSGVPLQVQAGAT